MFDALKDKVKMVWDRFSKKAGWKEVSEVNKEKTIAFLITIVLAFSLWIIVNLNRDYTLNIDIPVVLGQITTDKALAEELPQQVTASISGEGWSLLNVYKNPPSVFVDVSEQEVNLFEQVRRQLSSISNVTVQKVNPLTLQLNLEARQSKKVPVISNVQINFSGQYDFLGSPHLSPDSITVFGAASIIESINQWPTDTVEFNDVESGFTANIALKGAGPLLELSEPAVGYQVEVAEYIGEKVKVPIEIRNAPTESHISLSPSSVVIDFKIPIDNYVTLNGQPLFEAYVTYNQVMQDTTGFVAPQIEILVPGAQLQVTRLQPSQASYFMIME